MDSAERDPGVFEQLVPTLQGQIQAKARPAQRLRIPKQGIMLNEPYQQHARSSTAVRRGSCHTQINQY